ncbi:MAG: hypothetical protein NVS4B12_22970 [Ktedonobacteraceae bacterium]
MSIFYAKRREVFALLDLTHVYYPAIIAWLPYAYGCSIHYVGKPLAPQGEARNSVQFVSYDGFDV